MARHAELLTCLTLHSAKKQQQKKTSKTPEAIISCGLQLCTCTHKHTHTHTPVSASNTLSSLFYISLPPTQKKELHNCPLPSPKPAQPYMGYCKWPYSGIYINHAGVPQTYNTPERATWRTAARTLPTEQHPLLPPPVHVDYIKQNVVRPECIRRTERESPPHTPSTGGSTVQGAALSLGSL